MPRKGRGRRQKKAVKRLATIRQERGPDVFKEWGREGGLKGKGGRPRKVQS